jgi:hypothetical protein
MFLLWLLIDAAVRDQARCRAEYPSPQATRPWGLQRLSIGLVAVCDEINDTSQRCIVQWEPGSANCNKSADRRSRGEYSFGQHLTLAAVAAALKPPRSRAARSDGEALP